MDTTVITTGHLILRPWEGRDAVAVELACQDPEVQRWTTVPSPYTAEVARHWVHEASPAGWADGRSGSFAVLDATSGDLLGAVGLEGLARDEPEVGYWCAAPARGRGVMTEAVSAVCRWGFGALGLDHIGWRAAVGNWPSRALAEKCGFQVEGVRRHGLTLRGVHHDCWTATLLADDVVRDRRRLPAFPPVSDGVVTLRPWRADDAPEVTRACQDIETARWLRVASPYRPADGTAYVEQEVPAQWADGVAAEVAVVDAQDALLGRVRLGLGQRALGIGELGYWTAPWARGRGVAGRGIELMAQWAFGPLGLSRLELVADVANTASLRVAERTGFTREGVLVCGGREPRGPGRRDMVLLSRLTPGLASGLPRR